jgi:carbon storage regulator CsrA|tara:strand:+ start:289 stop:549 length:261 start_codon:yes stop_codon:yes gene_type:complete
MNTRHRLPERSPDQPKEGLLVLGRALGEKIVLQHPLLKEDIVIKVAELCSTRVKLGIKAPRDVSIVREELLKRDGVFVRPGKRGHL